MGGNLKVTVMDLLLFPPGRAYSALEAASPSTGLFFLTIQSELQKQGSLARFIAARTSGDSPEPSHNFSENMVFVGLDLQLNYLGKRKSWKTSWIESQEIKIFFFFLCY